jgi:hypothetical protein
MLGGFGGGQPTHKMPTAAALTANDGFMLSSGLDGTLAPLDPPLSLQATTRPDSAYPIIKATGAAMVISS